MQEIFQKAVKLELFNSQWYQSTYGLKFNSDFDAFLDYLRKSPYAPIAPSENFDGISYYENYPDVYNEYLSPLEHYIEFGIKEGRKIFPLRPIWRGRNIFLQECKSSFNLKKIAVVLHIFYVDFVEKFHSALSGVDFDFDLFVTTTNSDVEAIVEEIFSKNQNIKKINVKIVPNRGRNFGPFMVHFGKDLMEYDYFLHMHSKKSLYSGKEQLQWSNYLIEFLVRDKQILAKALSLMSEKENIGLYYPVSFWNLPTWANHWLKNKGFGLSFLKKEFGIECDEDFISYPVGGMFWAKTKALEPLLNRYWDYEDFPQEPIPADGTLLHVIERILPKIAKKQGYSELIYDPASGDFLEDKTHVFRSYFIGNKIRAENQMMHNDVLSFDIFDTLVKRDFYEPDYAKFLLPKKAGLSISQKDFVLLRNKSELEIRRRKNFQGDVSIYEIYENLSEFIKEIDNPLRFADLEFEIDLEMINSKPVMVDLLNTYAEKGKLIYLISDTYYSENQIIKLIEKIGVHCNYKLFVSSAFGLRKDNGSMWKMISDDLDEKNIKHRFVHFGDNACADGQNPGDLGLNNFHILGPLDKWEALEFPSVKKYFSFDDPSQIIKWGPLVSEIGSNPFI